MGRDVKEGLRKDMELARGEYGANKVSRSSDRSTVYNQASGSKLWRGTLLRCREAMTVRGTGTTGESSRSFGELGPPRFTVGTARGFDYLRRSVIEHV